MLTQPATVDCWHREGVSRRWRGHSRRRPGRPRIDPASRDLIRRMAAESALWGAPRIHGELLKLGIAISERTVSRYLSDRPTTRSQTWRTFVANHCGGQTFSPMMFAGSGDAVIAVDASDASFRPVRSIDASSIDGPNVDWERPIQPASLGVRLAQHHLQARTRVRQSGGRDPPRHLPLQPALTASSRTLSCPPQVIFTTDGSARSICPRVLDCMQP